MLNQQRARTSYVVTKTHSFLSARLFFRDGTQLMVLTVLVLHKAGGVIPTMG
jgi:hypothetical protein